MKAGLLKERILIQSPEIIQTDYGEKKTEWKIKTTTRANVKYKSHDRTTENNEIFYNVTIEFKVRDYVNIDEWDRIVYKGKQYKILSLLPNPDNREINITTELINE